MTSYLGRGLESTPGKPFGYAHAMEREEIRQHLRKRGYPQDLTFEFRVTRIQERLHRYKPRFADRPRPVEIVKTTSFTPEELRHLVELFRHANDPLSQSIAEKASTLLGI